MVGTAEVILSVWKLGIAVVRSREDAVQLWACVQEENWKSRVQKHAREVGRGKIL